MEHRSEQIEAALEQLARLHRLVELQLELHRLGRGFFFGSSFFFSAHLGRGGRGRGALGHRGRVRAWRRREAGLHRGHCLLEITLKALLQVTRNVLALVTL